MKSLARPIARRRADNSLVPAADCSKLCKFVSVRRKSHHRLPAVRIRVARGKKRVITQPIPVPFSCSKRVRATQERTRLNFKRAAPVARLASRIRVLVARNTSRAEMFSSLKQKNLSSGGSWRNAVHGTHCREE